MKNKKFIFEAGNLTIGIKYLVFADNEEEFLAQLKKDFKSHQEKSPIYLSISFSECLIKIYSVTLLQDVKDIVYTDSVVDANRLIGFYYEDCYCLVGVNTRCDVDMNNIILKSLDYYFKIATKYNYSIDTKNNWTYLYINEVNNIKEARKVLGINKKIIM